MIQYAIDEARAAGIKEFIFVTSRGKSALEDYFDHAPELEAKLRRDGKDELLEILKSTNMDSGAIAYIRQHKALGLGHAVWCARRLIGNEPFAVILPDDVIAAEKPCLQQMVEAYEEVGGSMVAAMEVAPDKASSYGVLDIAEDRGAIVNVRGMVEKPPAGDGAVEPGGDRPLHPDAEGAAEPQQDRSRRRWRDPADRCHRRRDHQGPQGLRLPLSAASGSIAGRRPGFLQATVAFGLARDGSARRFRRIPRSTLHRTGRPRSSGAPGRWSGSTPVADAARALGGLPAALETPPTAVSRAAQAAAVATRGRPHRTQIAADDILVAATVRNEMIRLPYFLEHYRKLGVGHFLFVDNGSDDGTAAWLAEQPDVSLWTHARTATSCRASGSTG